MHSRFWDVLRDIRSLINKPEEALFTLHTPIGAITVDRFVYRSETGFILLQGIDEGGRERTVGFSEHQLSTFALEIRTKPGGRGGQVRFNRSMAESLS